MKQKVKLLGHRVLIKLKETEKEVEGFDIVRTDDVDQTIGEVVTIGNEVTEVNVGDHVMVNRFSGTEIEIESKKHRVIIDNDVLLILRNEEE